MLKSYHLEIPIVSMTGMCHGVWDVVTVSQGSSLGKPRAKIFLRFQQQEKPLWNNRYASVAIVSLVTDHVSIFALTIRKFITKPNNCEKLCRTLVCASCT